MTEKNVILIVDDDTINRKLLNDFLQSQGFATIEAKNGWEALVVLEDTLPSLILSDLEMPKMTGMELLREIARREIDSPVVIMTGFGSIEYAVEAMKNGAADFLTKPIDFDYVIKVITWVLARNLLEKTIKEQQRQLDDDLRHAALFQHRLLPDEIDTPYLSFSYRFRPMIAIGGDYLTVHRYSDQRIAVAIYDVSGHGVTAAFVAHLAHNQLQQRLAEQRPPSNVIELVNRYLLKTIGGTSMYATMVVIVVDAEEGSLTVCNAGHPDVMIWRKEPPRVDCIRSNVSILGILNKLLKNQNNETRIELSPGDKVILYTDGFIEAQNPNGEILQHQGMMAMVQEYGHLSADIFLDTMFESLNRYQGQKQDDDLTMLVVEMKKKSGELL